MEKFTKGSEWRRWDLHIHTPETTKNDQYSGNSSDEKWKKFYEDIEKYIGDGQNATKSISVIGITDYLSVENYKKVISDNKLPGTIELVLPNVEMRMYPLSRQSAINIHFIFDPIIVDELESRFFSKMSLAHGGRSYDATKGQLIILGKKN